MDEGLNWSQLVDLSKQDQGERLDDDQESSQQQKQNIDPQSSESISSEQPQDSSQEAQEQSPHPSESSSSSHSWSKQVIQPAIKSMNFRPKRGTRMKQLMNGKGRKDNFWQKYQGYFGGDLNQKEEQDEQDYEASSSGRDEFDSDFDLTDSYAGKRGRKKGSKIKKRKGKDGTQKIGGAKRGRKRKVQVEQQQEEGRSKVRPVRSDDTFIIVRADRSKAGGYRTRQKVDKFLTKPKFKEQIQKQESSQNQKMKVEPQQMLQ